MEMEREMNACCYKVCCCDGDLDYYFFWACPTIYELCASWFPPFEPSPFSSSSSSSSLETESREEA